jgi:hypothetical protein
LSEALLRHETIDREQFLALLAGTPEAEVFADVHPRATLPRRAHGALHAPPRAGERRAEPVER